MLSMFHKTTLNQSFSLCYCCCCFIRTLTHGQTSFMNKKELFHCWLVGCCCCYFTLCLTYKGSRASRISLRIVFLVAKYWREKCFLKFLDDLLWDAAAAATLCEILEQTSQTEHAQTHTHPQRSRLTNNRLTVCEVGQLDRNCIHTCKQTYKKGQLLSQQFSRSFIQIYVRFKFNFNINKLNSIRRLCRQMYIASLELWYTVDP